MSSNEERQARKLQKRHLDEDTHARDEGLKHLLSTYEGRRYLWLLLEDCQAFGQPFTGNALTTAFNCGEQNVGKKILAHLMSTNPDAFLQMSKENEDEQRTRRDAADHLRHARDPD